MSMTWQDLNIIRDSLRPGPPHDLNAAGLI
jgi:hypothetical protein